MKHRRFGRAAVLAGSQIMMIFLLPNTSHAVAQSCPTINTTITFSEFSLGTSITDQYLPVGVVFSGSGSGPFISVDGANPTAPVLSGSPRFQGTIEARFVNPSDVTQALFAFDATVDGGFFDELESVAVDFVGLSSSGTLLNSQFGIENFSFPEPIESFVFNIVSSEPAGYAIDNLSFRLGAPFDILMPQKDDIFPFTKNDIRETDDITFETQSQNISGNVKWKLEFEYSTAAGQAITNFTEMFNGKIGQAISMSFVAKGGRIKVTAEASSGGSTFDTCPVEFIYIVGNAIPDLDITARLIGLYKGATANLLTGISEKESSYRQFGVFDKFGQMARWPLESFDGGSHIGLMQVPTTYDDAWDWHANTTEGARIFKEKLRTAARLERRIRNTFKGLRALTAVERENMALILYGPFAMAGLDNQYFRAEIQSGLPVWVVNTLNNPNGVAYADDARSKVH